MSSRSGHASKPTTRREAQQRAAAAKARLAAAQRRRRLWQVAAAVGTVLVLVLALVIVKVVVGGGPKSGQHAKSAQSSVVAAVTSVPASVLDKVGVGTATSTPKAITAPPLKSAGKPELFYAGAEYCPYCATERWAMVVALARFGTFQNLGQTASSPSDVYPSTPTLTFHDAQYASRYLTLTAKEMQSNQVVNGQYAQLDPLTPAQQQLMQKYDAPPYTKTAGSIPFVDIGGKYVSVGASYDPQVLQGKTHAQIAAALSDPASPISRGVNGTANVITAAVCDVTGGQPQAVCTAKGVTAAAKVLHHG